MGESAAAGSSNSKRGPPQGSMATFTFSPATFSRGAASIPSTPV